MIDRVRERERREGGCSKQGRKREIIHHGGTRCRRKDFQRHHETGQESHRKGVSLSLCRRGCVRQRKLWCELFLEPTLRAIEGVCLCACVCVCVCVREREMFNDWAITMRGSIDRSAQWTWISAVRMSMYLYVCVSCIYTA